MDNIFEALPDLPDDLAEAFDSMKLAIMRHQRQNWFEISERDVLTMLELLVEATQEGDK